MDYWQDRPVFITGATGLVGSHLTDRMVTFGADVVILMRDYVPSSELVRSERINDVTVVRGDVQDQDLVERVLSDYQIDTIFHLAAQAIVPIANRYPKSTWRSNIDGTLSVLDAARNCRVRSMVVASSDKAYGTSNQLPYTEDMPLRGTDPYSCSKSCVDLIAQSYLETYKLPVAIARCGNIFGGGDLHWNRIIPGTIRSLCRGEQPIIRSDGKMVRDYFYVEDAVVAYRMLAESGKTGAYNFSNETPMTVLEIVRAIAKVMQISVDPIVQNNASNEIAEQYLSAKKAHDELGWYPLLELFPALRETCNWYKEYLGG